MNTYNSAYIKAFWFSLFFLFFIASVFMIKRAMSPHNRLTHILIKPSSADNVQVIADSLKKSLYPIHMEKKGVEIANNNYPDLTKALEVIFSTQEPHEVNLEIIRIDFTKEQSTPCLTEIARRMRDKKDQWDKNLFFSVCTIDSKKLVLAIAEPLSN